MTNSKNIIENNKTKTPDKINKNTKLCITIENKVKKQVLLLSTIKKDYILKIKSNIIKYVS